MTEEGEESQNVFSSDEDSDAEDVTPEEPEYVDQSAQDLKLKQIKDKVESNPLDTASHSELITELRNQGDFEALRKAREVFQQLTPLRASFWEQWLDDEWKMAEDIEERRAMLKLFAVASQEVFSVPVALQHCQCLRAVREEEGATAWQAEMRGMLEVAVGLQGAHYMEGAEVWSAYRGFLKEMDGDAATAAVREAYLQQLRLPMWQAEKVFQEYCAWESDDVARRNAELVYERIHQDEVAEMRAEWEQQLATAVAAERWALWQQYINEEPSEAHRLVLYLRCISDCGLPSPNDPATVQTSLRFLFDFLKIVRAERPQLLRQWSSVSYRLLRTGDLWLNHLHVLEESAAAYSDCKSLIDNVMSKGMPTMAEYREVFLEFLAYCRRAYEATDASAAQAIAEDGRTITQTALEFFRNYQDQDAMVEIARLWAHTEVVTLKTQEKATALIRQVLGYMPHNYGAWCAFATLQRVLGNVAEARALLKEAVAAMPEAVYLGPIIAAWKELERQEGTLTTLQECHATCRDRLTVLQRHEQLISPDSAAPAEDAEADHPSPKKKERKPTKERKGKGAAAKGAGKGASGKGAGKGGDPAGKGGLNPAAALRQKIVAVKEQQAREQLARRQQLREQKSGRKAEPIALDPTPKTEEPATEEPNAAAVEDAPPGVAPEAGRKRSADSETEAAEQPPSKKVKKGETADTTVTRPHPGQDSRTAFVWNLPFDKTEADIQEWFQHCDVDAVHVARNKRGASQGFAYVTMANDRSMLKAFGFDKRQWDKRQVRVQQYDGSKTSKEKRDKGLQLLQASPSAAEGSDPAAPTPPVAPNPYTASSDDPSPAPTGGAGYLHRHKRGGFLGTPRAVLLRQKPPAHRPDPTDPPADAAAPESDAPQPPDESATSAAAPKGQDFFRQLMQSKH